MQVCRLRSDISFTVSPGDQQRLRAIAANRKSPEKHVWRARIILVRARAERCRQTSPSTWSSTTTRHSRRTRSAPGSHAIRAGPSISRRPHAPGPIPPRGSSPNSPDAGSNTASSTRWSISKKPTASFAKYNSDKPRPLVWKADPDDIIAARYHGFQTIESIH